MLDYILVYRGLDERVLSIRYGDAKHSQKNKEISKTDMKEVVDKAKRLHEALDVHCRFDSSVASLKYTVSPKYKVFIITNVNKMYVHEGIVFLTPDTFQFSPWTNILFDCPSSETDSSEAD